MPRKYIDIIELARRYAAGESVQQLAIAYNYTPSGIRYSTSSSRNNYSSSSCLK